MRFFGSGNGSGSATTVVNGIWRFLQLIAAVVVIGYYAQDLRAAHKMDKYSDSKWVYAVVVGTFAAVTALVYGVVGIFVPYLSIALLFGWEWILTILWAAAAGVFGQMYFKENAEMDSGIQRMKVAAGFDVANLILWFVSAVASTVMFFSVDRRSLFTGRAKE